MKNTIDNFFVIENYQGPGKSRMPKIANKLLNRFKINYEFKKKVDPFSDMNTLEQRINYYHLLTSTLMRNIEGEVVELGSFNGQCAMLFQKVLDAWRSDKELHLYDSFEVKFSSDGNIKDDLINNFKKSGLRVPFIHVGYFQETLSTGLPEKIAFAHIDCGFGGDKMQHKEVMLYCLEELYKRMTPGAMCVLMDYHDSSTIDPGMDCNPGVKLACDEFLGNKPEQVVRLYGGEASHGYFIKS